MFLTNQEKKILRKVLLQLDCETKSMPENENVKISKKEEKRRYANDLAHHLGTGILQFIKLN